MTKLQKLRRSLRAISPVIAVLLMIAIAVVASLVAYAWIMGYIGFQTGKTGQAIQITSYAEGALDNNHMRIYVQNVGQGTAEVNSVFINDESVPIDSPADLTIAKGATITLVVDLGTDTWNSGEKVKIKVITEDGTFAEKQGTGSGGPSGTPAPTWTMTSSIEGAGFVTVDGAPITTPQTFNWVPGTSHNFVAISPVSGATGTQYVYTDWSDGGAQTHVYVVPASPETVTANYKTQYQVTFAVSPSGAGTTTPATATWYDAGVSGQAISAAKNSGYTFSEWTCDPADSVTFASSTSISTTMTVNAPSTVTANFDQNPPQTVTLLNDGFEEKWDSSTPWDRQTDQHYSGSYSINSDNSNEGNLDSYRINAQSSTSITVSFRLRHTDIGNSEFRLYFFDNNGNADSIASLGDYGGSDNYWHLYTYTTTDSQYRHSNFRIRFNTNFGYNDDVWVDDVQVTVTGGAGTTFTDGFEAADPNWNTNWDATSSSWDPSSTAHSGSIVSALSSDGNEGSFTCDSLVASDATSITVDFWFMLDDTEASNLILEFYDGSNWDTISATLGTYGAHDTWLHFTSTTTDSQYFDSTFRIRFTTSLDSGENVWIDDVLITKQVIPP